MSFVSKAWSCETLCRGINLVGGASMSLESDPDTAAMQAELDRLMEAKPNLTMFGKQALVHLSPPCVIDSSFFYGVGFFGFELRHWRKNWNNGQERLKMLIVWRMMSCK